MTHNTFVIDETMHEALYRSISMVTAGQSTHWWGTAMARMSMVKLSTVPKNARLLVTTIAPRLARYFDAGRILDLAKYHELSMDFSEEGYIDFNFDGRFSITAKIVNPVCSELKHYQTLYTTGKPLTKLTSTDTWMHPELVRNVCREFWLDALAVNDGWHHAKARLHEGLSYVVPCGDFDIEWQLTFDREYYNIWLGN